MKKYSILIVGIKCYFGHLQEFVINLKKKNPLVDITLLISSISDERKRELIGYVDRIVVCKTYSNKVIPKFFRKGLNLFLYHFEFLWLHLRNRFDVVDIHFANREIKHVMPILRKMTKNIVISPWGSDVMRVDSKEAINDMCKIYSQARYVTISKDSQLGQCIIDKFKVDPQKMVDLSWGGEFFDYVEKNLNNIRTEQAKERFGLKGRYVITCGYNTQQSQKHEEIMNAINSVKDQLPNNLAILIPCTYVLYKNLSEQKINYIETLEERGKSLGLDVVVIREHLNLADLLKLRMATDIFVHVQTTDAGSRSVMEYVFCNKKVVHGAWMKYPYLEDYKPSCYFPVDKMAKLGACIVKAYNSQVGELPQEVRKIILERGWNYKMSQWNAFFESLVS